MGNGLLLNTETVLKLIEEETKGLDKEDTATGKQSLLDTAKYEQELVHNQLFANENSMGFASMTSNTF